MVVERGSLSTLQRYRNDVGNVDLKAYRELLVPFFATDTGRNHYRDVIQHMKAICDLEFDDEFATLVDYLREKHSHRPVFLSELEKAEF